MKFIKLTDARDEETIYINLNRVHEIRPLKVGTEYKGSSLFFGFSIENDYAATDVMQTPEEILKLIKE